MKKIFMAATVCMLFFACNNEKKEDSNQTTTTSGDKKPSFEALDLSEGDVIKNSFSAFGKGDIEGMTAAYDDNIRYTWSGGDSLIGKKAVQDFWKNRWSKVIDSLSFSEHIVVPIIANVKQSEFAPTGKWILHWVMTNVTYKNKAKLVFWSHSVNHINDGGKVDFIGMYYDQHTIYEATKDLVI
jgi:hypothetical protein